MTVQVVFVCIFRYLKKKRKKLAVREIVEHMTCQDSQLFSFLSFISVLPRCVLSWSGSVNFWLILHQCVSDCNIISVLFYNRIRCVKNRPCQCGWGGHLAVIGVILVL